MDFKTSSTEKSCGDDKGNIPYCKTEINPSLQDIIDQPKLTNPGSNDKILISDAQLAESFVNMNILLTRFLAVSGKREGDYVFYICGVYVENNSMLPAYIESLKPDDYGTEYTLGTSKITDFCQLFCLAKKRYYENEKEAVGKSLYGMFHRCIETKDCLKIENRENEFAVKWPFEHMKLNYVKF